MMVSTRSSEQEAPDLAAQLDEIRQQSEKRTAELKTELQSQLAELKDLIVSTMNPNPNHQPLADSTHTSTSHPRDNMPGDPPFTVLNPKPPDLPRQSVPLSADPQRPPLLLGGLSTRLSKVEFPRFDGTMLREWIYKCEQFFTLDGTLPEMKVRLASLHMEGKALQWHHNHMSTRYDQYPSWPEYIISVSGRFGRLFDDPLAELVSLKQGSESVEDFLDKFECAMTRLQLPVHHALSIFLTNLNQHLALHVRQFNPTTLHDAARIARLHESSLQHTPAKPHTRTPFNPYPRPASTPPNTKPTAPLLPSPDQSKSLPKTPAKQFEKQGRRYSYDEMQERRRNGLCMFCEEAYSPGHHLKHKRAQIYVMDCDEDSTDFSEDDDQHDNQNTAGTEDHPNISVNALDGSATFNCMRVIGQVAKTRVHILIDPGSSHNFLDLAMAKELGCALDPVKPLSVSAANGNNMLSSFRCASFCWKLQGYSFCTEVRTLPLDCCDLVLGVQWLTTLGPICWDFSSLRMEFTLAGTKHVLRGVTKSNCKVIKGSTLNKLLIRGPQLAFLCLREISSDSPTLEPAALFSHIATAGVDNSNDPDLQSMLAQFSVLGWKELLNSAS